MCSSDLTPARELLDRKGPSGATIEAHTPRIPKGRASITSPRRLRTFHAGSLLARLNVALVSRHRNARKSRAAGRSDERREGRPSAVTRSYEGFQAPRPSTSASSSRKSRSPKSRSLRRHGLPPGCASQSGENLRTGSFRETTRGVRAPRRRGSHGRNRRGAFTSGARPMSRVG